MQIRREQNAKISELSRAPVVSVDLVGTTMRAQVVLFSDLGPDRTFNTGAAASIFHSGIPTPLELESQSFADAFTISASSLTGRFYLTQIDLAVSGASPLVVQLAEDASGAPGKVLESWNVPSPTLPLTTVVDTLNLQLYAGERYWVIVRPFTYSASDLWYDSFTGTNAVDVFQVFLEAGNPIPITGGWLPCASRPDLSCSSAQAFDVIGLPVNLVFPPVGLGPNQYLRFIVQGPITPAPGSPVEVNLSFTDINGNAIGPSSLVTIDPGQTLALDLRATDYLKAYGQRVEVIPVVTEVSNPNILAPGTVRASVQVMRDVLGIATVLFAAPDWPNSAVLSYPPNPIAPLVPQDLTVGQTQAAIDAATWWQYRVDGENTETLTTIPVVFPSTPRPS